MMPLWLLILGRFYLDPEAVEIPYLNIFMLLLPVVIPMAVGVIIRRFSPKLANKIAVFTRPLSLAFIIYVIGFGMYVNWYMYEIMGSQAAKVIPAAVLLPTLGYVIALGIAVLARRKWKEVVAISIETGIQNSAIPIIILQGSFPQPEGDLAAVMPVATSLFFAAPLILVGIVYIVWKRTHPDANNNSKYTTEGEHNNTQHTENGTIESSLNGPAENGAFESGLKDSTENSNLGSGLNGSAEATWLWKACIQLNLRITRSIITRCDNDKCK